MVSQFLFTPSAASRPVCYVHYTTTNGYGSSGTRIRKYTDLTASANVGTEFTADNSATSGLSITINASGFYSFSYSEVFGEAEAFGLSIHAPDLMVDVTSLAVANILALSSTWVADQASNASWSGYLVAGDVVRPHTRAGSASGVAVRGRFWASAI